MGAFEQYFSEIDFAGIATACNNWRPTAMHLERFVTVVRFMERLGEVEHTAREVARRFDTLRAEADALAKVTATADEAQSRLDHINAELDKHRAAADAERQKIVESAQAAAHDIVEEARSTAARIIADGRATAAEEKARHDAEMRRLAGETDRLSGEIATKRNEHDTIAQALADLRSRIGT